jgi:hypothetical protein
MRRGFPQGSLYAVAVKDGWLGVESELFDEEGCGLGAQECVEWKDRGEGPGELC